MSDIAISHAARLRSSHKKRRDTIGFYLFISPWLIGFFGLTLGPMLYSLFGALSSWDGVRPPQFIGLGNFINIFTNDDVFLTATRNTFYYAIASVPTSIILSLLLALLLDKKRPGAGLLQMIYYFPSVCAGIAVYMVWIWFFNGETGVINYIFSLVGIKGPNWLADPNWAMPAIILMNLTFCGGQMLIFIAGLKQIPAQYYEAALIEGASGRQRFLRITLPLLSPVILFNTIMGLIGAFQVFGQVLVLTEGGPIKATYVYGYEIYKTAFLFFRTSNSATRPRYPGSSSSSSCSLASRS